MILERSGGDTRTAKACHHRAAVFYADADSEFAFVA
jgi:hypothetical protein